MTFGELRLIATVGAVFAMGSLGIDAILPALPIVAVDLAAGAINKAQFVVTAFVIGMGIGMFAGGPLSDRLGRKPLLVTGALIYTVSAVFGGLASSMPTLLTARVIQGVGASFASAAMTGMVRDLYAGPAMARIMSFAMMIFATMPAVAPLLGHWVMQVGGWHAVFGLYAGFGLLVSAVVTAGRETLATSARRAVTANDLITSLSEALSLNEFRRAMFVQVCFSAMLFATLANIQPVFDHFFAKGASFPRWFALIALAVFLSSFGNGMLVERLGPARLSRFVLLLTSGIALAATVFQIVTGVPFSLFIAAMLCVFLTHGLSSGNIIAIALTRLGHIAGTAGALLHATAMLVGSLLSIPVTLAFDGTPIALLAVITIAAGLSAHVVGGMSDD